MVKIGPVVSELIRYKQIKKNYVYSNSIRDPINKHMRVMLNNYGVVDD